MTEPSYIDRIAIAIHQEAEPDSDPTEDLALYRLYAVLLLAKGESVTDEDVHDAWAAWASEHQPGHRSLVLFRMLPYHIQEMDRPYTLAIHAVSARMKIAATMPPEAAKSAPDAT